VIVDGIDLTTLSVDELKAFVPAERHFALIGVFSDLSADAAMRRCWRTAWASSC
jgi:hypothetical protein